MPSRATLIALLALFVALGGPAEAAKLINGKNIKAGTVRSAQIKDKSLTTTDLSKGTVRSLRTTPANSIGSAQLLDGAVTLSKIAPGSFTGNQIADRSVSAVDLVTDTLTAAEIAPNAVDNSELATNAVSNAKLRTGAATKGKISTNAVGTEEAIDHALTGVDIGKASGTLSADLTPVPANSCTKSNFASPTYAIPAGALAGTLVMVGAPVNLPDDLVVTGKPIDANTLRIQVCNPTGVSSADSGALDYSYLAIAP